MERDLGSFQHRIAQWINRRQPRRWVVGVRGGGYPLLAAAMEEANFEEIGVYIKKKQNTVAQYIVTRPILDLCEKTDLEAGSLGFS